MGMRLKQARIILICTRALRNWVIEKKIIRFYTEAAEQSEALLADIHRIFSTIIKKRGQRIEKLGSFLNKEDSQQ